MAFPILPIIAQGGKILAKKVGQHLAKRNKDLIVKDALRVQRESHKFGKRYGKKNPGLTRKDITPELEVQLAQQFLKQQGLRDAGRIVSKPVGLGVGIGVQDSLANYNPVQPMPAQQAEILSSVQNMQLGGR